MKFFKRNDVLVILLIIIASLAAWAIYSLLFSGKAARAEIYYNSRLVMTVALEKGKERTFSIPQKKNVVFELDKEGNIRFKESDCPDKVCVNAGKLHIVGQSAACLPNGVVLKIIPAKEHGDDELDVIVGK